MYMHVHVYTTDYFKVETHCKRNITSDELVALNGGCLGSWQHAYLLHSTCQQLSLHTDEE